MLAAIRPEFFHYTHLQTQIPRQFPLRRHRATTYGEKNLENLPPVRIFSNGWGSWASTVFLDENPAIGAVKTEYL